jgi:hypothetical protein
LSSRPSLRSQLNQIRLWLRQGRTDAWIAHKLDISVDQLAQFKRDQRLDGEPHPGLPAVEAIPTPPEVLPLADEALEPELEEPEAPVEGAEEEADLPARGRMAMEAEGEPRRRRGRRGGRRRRGRRATSYEGTFEHGGEGYGLWLDPAVVEDANYASHWAGHRAVTVTIGPDEITIRRAEDQGSERSSEAQPDELTDEDQLSERSSEAQPDELTDEDQLSERSSEAQPDELTDEDQLSE